MSRQAGMLSGPTTPRHEMQSLGTSPWHSCDFFATASMSKDQVDPKRHTTLFIGGCQLEAGL